MIENLTRLGVDLGAPTLLAFTVVALVAGLLGLAAGSLLELLRTRSLARRELMDPVTYDAPARQASAMSYDEVPIGYEARSLAWAAPAVAFSEPGMGWASPTSAPSGAGLGPESFSDSGLEEWYTGTTRRSGVGLKLAALVALATLSVAGSLGAGVLIVLSQVGR